VEGEKDAERLAALGLPRDVQSRRRGELAAGAQRGPQGGRSANGGDPARSRCAGPGPRVVTFGQAQGLQPMISVASYMDFVIKFTLAFGVVFELPVVITLLFMLGIVTPQFLSRNRKYAILINFIIAA
jgi:hypothetical protein